MQSQVSFNRVPEKVLEALVQSHVRFNRICGHLIHGNPAEVFPALGFAARFRKICKNKTLRLLGIPSKLIFLLVEKTLRTSAFPSVHIVGSFTSKLLSTDMYNIYTFYVHIYIHIYIYCKIGTATLISADPRRALCPDSDGNGSIDWT